MRKKATYKSHNEVIIRKKAGLKETQEQDWEGVGLPVIKRRKRPLKASKRSAPIQALSINWVKGQHIDKEIHIKGGKGFKLKKKGIKSTIVKGTNVDMFKDKWPKK